MLKIVRLWKNRRKPLTEVCEVESSEPRISAELVEKIILNHFGYRPFWFWKYLLTDARIYIGDPWYNPVTEEDLETICNTCREVFQNIKYIPTIFDCDDFTRVLIGQVSLLRYRHRKNYAFGYVWVLLNIDGEEYGHATCFYINDRLEFRWYEPQLCKTFNFDKYSPKLILCVI